MLALLCSGDSGRWVQGFQSHAEPPGSSEREISKHQFQLHHVAAWADLHFDALRLRGGLSQYRSAAHGARARPGGAGAGHAALEMPVFRYVTCEEDKRRAGGDHRNSKWRKDHRQEEETEEADDGIDTTQLMQIDEEKVAALLQRHKVSAKSLRRNKARKLQKDLASTLEEMARFDPRKRTGEEWVNIEMGAQSFHRMRQEVTMSISTCTCVCVFVYVCVCVCVCVYL